MFWNLIKSNRNQIVFTIFRLIWNSKRTINRCMVNTIWFRFHLIRLRKDFSVCADKKKKNPFWARNARSVFRADFRFLVIFFSRVLFIFLLLTFYCFLLFMFFSVCRFLFFSCFINLFSFFLIIFFSCFINLFTFFLIVLFFKIIFC